MAQRIVSDATALEIELALPNQTYELPLPLNTMVLMLQALQHVDCYVSFSAKMTTSAGGDTTAGMWLVKAGQVLTTPAMTGVRRLYLQSPAANTLVKVLAWT